jgi:SAM-dependent methyltransferase
MNAGRQHWESVYAERAPTEVSWFEEVPRVSLDLIDSLHLDRAAPVLDVGGGASRLAGELLGRGFTDLTVADISAGALERARDELGPRADEVDWEVADVRDHDFGRQYELWHDRAVFHFMVDAADAGAYTDAARRAIASGGHAVVATFGPDGPTSCSGLSVSRYSAEEIAVAFGSGFELVASREVEHHTPGGSRQQFVYALLRRSTR